MARASKEGIDYFPTDTNFLANRKIKRLTRKHGPMAISAVIAILSLTYSEKGYYLEWNEDVCFDLSELANTDTEKLQALLIDAMRVELFHAGMFKQYGILTSESIQKQYIQCTQKRKNVVLKEKYKLTAAIHTETSQNVPQTGVSSPQNLFPGEETPVWGEEITQRKEKETESKQKEKEQQTTPTPTVGGGKETAGGRQAEEKIPVNGRWVPRRCLNKRTHNYDGLLERLNQIHVTEIREVNKILEKSDYGRIGHPLWGIISHSNWPRGNTIKFPGKFILSQLRDLAP